jgi:hypothetical protein
VIGERGRARRNAPKVKKTRRREGEGSIDPFATAKRAHLLAFCPSRSSGFLGSRARRAPSIYSQLAASVKARGASSAAHWIMHVDPSRHSTLHDARHTNVHVDSDAHVALELAPISTVQSAPLTHV